MPLPYKKLPLNFEKQADRLMQRGLSADRDELIHRLKSVNYYRLSGYWYNYRIDLPACEGTVKKGDDFKPGTCFKDVWDTYTFDRRLRLCLFDAIERLEVDFKTKFVYELTMRTNDAFAHLNRKNFPGLPSKRIRLWNWAFSFRKKRRYTPPCFPEIIRHLKKQELSSVETFAKEHQEKYGDIFPFWKTVELSDFGTVLNLYKGLDKKDKAKISAHYSLEFGVFENILEHFKYIRNMCAHHSRVWNKELARRFTIPKAKNRPEFHDPFSMANNRIFSTLSMLKFLMDKIAPQSAWTFCFFDLMRKYPAIDKASMGFPENWNALVVWKTSYERWGQARQTRP